MNAYAQGPDNGITPANGAEVKGYVNITLNDFNSDHGVYVSQNVSTLVNRRFMVTGPGQYIFDGHLSGPADVDLTFSSFLGGSFCGASYDLNAHASIDGFILDDNGLIVSNLGSVATFEFNNSDRDGNSLVELISREDGENVMYALTVFLEMGTDLQNFDPRQGLMDDLTGMGPFEVGTAGLPFELSASICPVPLPGSLVLLFSSLRLLLSVLFAEFRLLIFASFLFFSSKVLFLYSQLLSLLSLFSQLAFSLVSLFFASNPQLSSYTYSYCF